MNTSIRPCLDTPIPAAMRDLAAKIRWLGITVTPETIEANTVLGIDAPGDVLGKQIREFAAAV
jgi:hypothetical protein